jgi:multidrug transporter EmrE-like cation transporter
MGSVDFVPMIKAPSGWPLALVAVIAMLALAGLDLVGAVAAKEWAHQRSVPALVLGAVTFLTLFWVYASSLQYAELALVTMGWVAILQVGLLVIDRVRYGVELPAGKWVAVVLLLAAQAYLLLAPSSSTA